MTTWWCEHALIDGTVERGVTIDEREGRFVRVQSDTRTPSGATVLQGFTVPGFANAHSHAFHRALRSRVQAERGSFWTWRRIMYRAAEQLHPDNYHRLARAVFAEMAVAGMAVVGEFHYVHHLPNGAPYQDPNAMGQAVLAAAADAGVRITLLDALYLHGGIEGGGHKKLDGVQHRFSDGEPDRWVERVGRLNPSPGQRIGAAIHSVRAVDPDGMAVVAEWASAHDAPLHAHVSEQTNENDQLQSWLHCTPLELLESVGVLQTRFTAVHATHLTEHDVALLGIHNAFVCMCPTTERDLGDGIGPTPELVRAGASLCLGSDSHAVVDQMTEARAVELNERLRSQQRGIHSAPELMTMATTSGHRSLGWDDAGSIAEGMRADLVTIDLDTPRLAGSPGDLLVEAAIFASTVSDITSVIIDGKTVASRGLHHVVDVAAELNACIEELLT
jgi:formiminoglutamate deiminase